MLPSKSSSLHATFIFLGWLGFFWQQHLTSAITATVSICGCFSACDFREPATQSCHAQVYHRGCPGIGAPLRGGTSIPPTPAKSPWGIHASVAVLVQHANVPISTGQQMGGLSIATCTCLHRLCYFPVYCAWRVIFNGCGCLPLLEGLRTDDGKHSAAWITDLNGKRKHVQVRTGNACQQQWCTYNVL